MKLTNETKTALHDAAVVMETSIAILASGWTAYLSAWNAGKVEAAGGAARDIDDFKNAAGDVGDFARLIALRLRNAGLNAVLDSVTAVSDSQNVTDVGQAVERRLASL